ncbi:hypothetical protein ABT294_08570 [Nonomuraea sp. NPDC000554]|uniref:hypothetical protein n=1 Tax=Nonomuraea sp. NPDC000554 TaxID=3154259 RepID=UPI0033205005
MGSGGPSAPDGCGGRPADGHWPAPTTALCEGLDGTPTDPLAVPVPQGAQDVLDSPVGGELSAAVDRMARRAGLAGLTTVPATMSVADAAGMAATSGLPRMPEGVPGPAGLRCVETVAQAPNLPLRTFAGRVAALRDAVGLTYLSARRLQDTGGPVRTPGRPDRPRGARGRL